MHAFFLLIMLFLMCSYGIFFAILRVASSHRIVQFIMVPSVSFAYSSPPFEVSVAPMMAYTDTYFRTLLECIHPDALLYTEMIHADALVRRDHWRAVLQREARQRRLVIQLGGSCPQTLAKASARIAEVGGFEAINFNVGCPSPRVQAGRFGACLFAEPDLVAACVSAMQASSCLPVTVKTRLGIDHMDRYEDTCHFIATVAKTGCETFIMHARKAWLKGLNPAQNRSVPPLQYARVAQLAKDFPQLRIIINGGIQYADVLAGQHQAFDGVMLGRCVHADPLGLHQLLPEPQPPQDVLRQRVAMAYLDRLSAFGYTQISPRLVTPLVLISKGFSGARAVRAAWVAWGKKHADIATTRQKFFDFCPVAVED